MRDCDVSLLGSVTTECVRSKCFFVVLVEVVVVVWSKNNNDTRSTLTHTGTVRFFLCVGHSSVNLVRGVFRLWIVTVVIQVLHRFPSAQRDIPIMTIPEQLTTTLRLGNNKQEWMVHDHYNELTSNKDKRPHHGTKNHDEWPRNKHTCLFNEGVHSPALLIIFSLSQFSRWVQQIRRSSTCPS